MNFEDPSQISLAGSLILAAPSLQDPNFSRTVLYLCGHDSEEGAHGFILNRPIGSTVSDFLTSDDFSGLADVPVYMGGPVQTEQLTFAALDWDRGEGRIQFGSHLSREGALEALEEGRTIRAFIGYSGWTGGQLEGELMQRAWITSSAGENLLELPHDDVLWADILRSMGPWYQLLADMPPDPSLN